jgi:hypothetical protein
MKTLVLLLLGVTLVGCRLAEVCNRSGPLYPTTPEDSAAVMCVPFELPDTIITNGDGGGDTTASTAPSVLEGWPLVSYEH